MTTNNTYTPLLRFPEFRGDIGWTKKLVKDVCSINTGKSNTQDQVKEGKYPFFIRSQEAVRSNKYLYDCEAVITIGDGRIGQVYHYINGKFDLHQRCYKMSDFQGVIGKFFYYYFSAHFYERAMKMSAKATVDSVRLEMISEMPIFVPSLSEQRKIADSLSSIDDSISSTQEKLQLLQEHKKGLMQQLFPMFGKNTPELRFHQFVNTSDWQETQLDQIGDTLNGLSGKGASDFGTGKLYVTYKQVFKGRAIDFSECANVNIKPNETQTRVQSGDVLVTTSSETAEEIGYTAVVKGTDIPECYLNSFCFAYRLTSTNTLDTDFATYLFCSPIYRKNIVRIAQGYIRVNISKSKFLEIILPIPQDIKEQEKIGQCLSSLDDLIDLYSKKILHLKEQRKGLLQQLFPKI